MIEVMNALEQERKRLNVTTRKLAIEAEIDLATYSRQLHGKQPLGLAALQGYAKWARTIGSVELLRVIGAYALGLEPEQIIIKPIE